MKKGDEPIVVEASYDAPAETVWAAITQVDQMRQWYFEEIPEFEPKVGFETLFIVETDERTFPHRWTVTNVEPGKSIQYDWSYDGYDGKAYVLFEVFPVNEGSRMKLTCHVRETFPDEVPEFNRESCIAGWKYFLNDRLPSYLAD